MHGKISEEYKILRGPGKQHNLVALSLGSS